MAGGEGQNAGEDKCEVDSVTFGIGSHRVSRCKKERGYVWEGIARVRDVFRLLRSLKGS